MEKSLNRGYIVRFEHNLQNVYGNGALKYATVCKWVRRFNDGRE